MEIELELDTKLTDVSEVIEKLSPILKSVKDQGFTIKELEIESSDQDHVNTKMMNSKEYQLIEFMVCVCLAFTTSYEGNSNREVS
jgi:regulatory protein YycI of two-component signal transduction system YycFG